MLVRCEGDLPEIGEMIAVALRAEKIAGAALETGEKSIVPHRFIQNRRGKLASAWPPAGAKMRAGLEPIHEFYHRVVVDKEAREHRTTDIGRMCSGQDRVLRFNCTPDGNGRDAMA